LGANGKIKNWKNVVFVNPYDLVLNMDNSYLTVEEQESS
jgi:hypothetical protein